MRIAVSDLVGHPGETRQLTRQVTLAEVSTEPWGPAEDTLDGPLDLDLRLESVVEGILVRGQVRFVLVCACARCLEPVREHLDVPVVELFRQAGHPEAEPGYEIVDRIIDLEALLRDAVVMSVPLRVLCRPDCRGLCPSCGADLNQGDCGHSGAPRVDPRWAPLLELRLPPTN